MSCGTYYFVRNIQGDVIALVDESGNRLVEYTYDAWGNILDTVYYGDAQYYATYNPFRYRGYVYDIETGLYYLNSRYYDPEIGRFINADNYISTGQGFLGRNMFAYCLNNPVCYHDKSGDMADSPAGVAGVEIGKFLYELLAGRKHPSREIEQLEIKIIEQQTKMVQSAFKSVGNVGKSLWDAYERGYRYQQEAQLQNTKALIEGFEYFAHNPKQAEETLRDMVGVSITAVAITKAIIAGTAVSAGPVVTFGFALWDMTWTIIEIVNDFR